MLELSSEEIYKL